MSERKCETCEWWLPLSKATGQCHAHAPKPTLVKQTEFFIGWPETEAEDFCGEWTSKPLSKRLPGINHRVAPVVVMKYDVVGVSRDCAIDRIKFAADQAVIALLEDEVVEAWMKEGATPPPPQTPPG